MLTEYIPDAFDYGGDADSNQMSLIRFKRVHSIREMN